MKLLTTLKISMAAALVLAMPAVLTPAVTYAQDNEQSSQSEDNKSEESSSVYSYEAQPGDSYSLIARKAVQTYGAINKVNLSQAQIIYAETHLTQSAGSPNLTEGQKVEIKESDVKHQVEHAQELTDAQEANWNYYAQFADFNTDRVGQSN